MPDEPLAHKHQTESDDTVLFAAFTILRRNAPDLPEDQYQMVARALLRLGWRRALEYHEIPSDKQLGPPW